MTQYFILALSFIFIAFPFLIFEKQDWLVRNIRVKGMGYLMFFLLIMTGAGFMVGAQSQAPLSVFPLNVISNTVYLNSNSATLYVYASASNSYLQSYLSLNATSLSPVFNSPTQVLIVPSNTFYKFNYSATSYFTGELVNSS